MAGKPTTFPANPKALDHIPEQARDNWEAAKAKAAAEDLLGAEDSTPGKPASFPASLTGREHMAERAAENTADWGQKNVADKNDLAEIIDAHAAAPAVEALTPVAEIELPGSAASHLSPVDFALPEAFFEHAGFEHANPHAEHVSDLLF